MPKKSITSAQGRYSSLFTAARDKKDSPAECTAIIKKAESHARHAQDWRLCAEAWLECLNDIDNANRCLLEAECRFHDICRELAICATGWLSLLRNPEAAQRCVRKIASIAKSAEDWDYGAEFLANAGCRKLAGFCLKQSERYASNSEEWLERARLWRDLLHDEENSRRCEATLARLSQCSDIVLRTRMVEEIHKRLTDNFNISLQQDGSAES
ncbi:MAG: hypothetical protein WC637_20360 [Victivallales bacterium]|jgi:hypothetical protein